MQQFVTYKSLKSSHGGRWLEKYSHELCLSQKDYMHIQNSLWPVCAWARSSWRSLGSRTPWRNLSSCRHRTESWSQTRTQHRGWSCTSWPASPWFQSWGLWTCRGAAHRRPRERTGMQRIHMWDRLLISELLDHRRSPSDLTICFLWSSRFVMNLRVLTVTVSFWKEKIGGPTVKVNHAKGVLVPSDRLKLLNSSSRHENATFYLKQTRMQVSSQSFLPSLELIFVI